MDRQFRRCTIQLQMFLGYLVFLSLKAQMCLNDSLLKLHFNRTGPTLQLLDKLNRVTSVAGRHIEGVSTIFLGTFSTVCLKSS